MRHAAVAPPPAAAATPRRLVAAAVATQQQAATAVPRRAVDVVIVGDSLQAYAAAYLLARRGKRTVLVEHAAPQLAAAHAGRRRPDVPLHLPATTPHRVSEASEALALWRGVEAASGARDLLQLCGSADVAPVRGSGAASEALGRMQDASMAAGLQFAMLAPDEATAAFPRLRPPRGTAALYTPAGGVAQGQVAAAVLRAMAQRAGADISPAPAAGRCLLGWRDAGSYFAVRAAPAGAAVAAAGGSAAGAAAASSGEGEVVYEAEQLLLLPEAAVQRPSLALFGLAVPGARLWGVPAARWRAQEDCAAVPLWQLLGTGSKRTTDDPAAVDSCWGTPVLGWAPGGLLAAHSLADGRDLDPPPAEQQQQGQQGQPGSPAAAAEAQLGAGLSSSEAATAAAAAASAAAAAALLTQEERPGSEEAIDAELRRLAEEQQQQQAAARRLGMTGALAAQLVSGVGGRQHQASAGSSAGDDEQLLLHCIVTPDGEPGVGGHPGLEDGRLVAAFPAACTELGCLPGDQLAPLVARLAVDGLLGRAPEAVDAAAVALGREALAAAAVQLRHDTWAELGSALQ